MSYFVPLMSYRLPCKPYNVLMAIAELSAYILDLIGIPWWYDTLMDWAKWNTRPLTPSEISDMKKYYGDNVDYNLVRIDSRAKWTANKIAIAYVAFNTINHYHTISKDVFVHEMMHIWQYQKLGSVYALKALYAQAKGNAYDYGGLEALYQGMLKNKRLLSYNFEQQAEIVQDYSRAKEYESMSPLEESVYLYYVQQIY